MNYSQRYTNYTLLRLTASAEGTFFFIGQRGINSKLNVQFLYFKHW